MAQPPNLTCITGASPAGIGGGGGAGTGRFGFVKPFPAYKPARGAGAPSHNHAPLSP
jgi:hypothetical protein